VQKERQRKEKSYSLLTVMPHGVHALKSTHIVIKSL
jgi:hypothetical protein